jgi:tetratricopeptide (TPR) repeat protein
MKRVIWVVLAVVVMASSAWADDQPWAAGVSDAQKKDAQGKLEEGNALFLKHDYKEALEKYRDALKSWDHPAIRFNVVRCLIQLDQPIDAAENLEAALKYGQAPLEEAVYNEALAYQKLFAKNIGDLEITCSQDGVRVSLDGKVVIEKCPGKSAHRVTPGAHQVVGEKPDFLTTTDRVKVVGGEHDTAEVKLVPLAKAAKVVHRWPVWMPWLVFGTGLGVVGLGAGLDFLAKNHMSDYDSAVATECGTTGCTPGSDAFNRLQSQKNSAKTEADLSYAMLGVGAAAAITGGVMLYLNRGQTVYEKPPIEVTPTSGGAAVSFSGHF